MDALTRRIVARIGRTRAESREATTDVAAIPDPALAQD
jgi:hypothetical protein